jgi:UDP-N-acetyl-D-galactosamine dehydrogenase
VLQVNENLQIGVIGLGYVGLPLAVEFAKAFNVVGFDINENRIGELRSGFDRTREVEEDLTDLARLEFSHDMSDLVACDVYVVTVPTPIDEDKRPNLNPLLNASKTVGQVLNVDNVVIFESTVFPGATEENCVPILERESQLKLNSDFFVGYSPERINPGDREHRLPDILKVTSGSTSEAADFIDELYKKIIRAGTYRANSIKVAEAAKVIENTQRDLNIALVNELSKIFHTMDIDTNAVLDAAATKWNFSKFKPGLVGGHCIGVDPYYLTYKAQQLKYTPEVILSGRRINDGMGEYVANRVIRLLVDRELPIKNAPALVMGITFKEDCPDIRNSRAVDIVAGLEQYGMNVDVYDPHCDSKEVTEEFGISLIDKPIKKYACVVLAVPHAEFCAMEQSHIEAFCMDDAILFDVKAGWPISRVDGRL